MVFISVKRYTVLFILIICTFLLRAQDNSIAYISKEQHKNIAFDKKKSITILFSSHKKLKIYSDHILTVMIQSGFEMVSAQTVETNQRVTQNSVIQVDKNKKVERTVKEQEYKSDYLMNFSAIIPPARGKDDIAKINVTIVDRISGKILVNYIVETEPKIAINFPKQILQDFATWLAKD